MFGTLRYEPQSAQSCFQSGRYTSQRFACDTCRARKVRDIHPISVHHVISSSADALLLLRQLKCGGQKKGCDRCKSMSTKCIYSEPGSSSRRRGKHPTISGHDNKPVSPNSSTRSPNKHTPATQYPEPAKTLGSPAGSIACPRNSNAIEESTLFPEDDHLFSSFASPMQPMEEDSIIPDHILDDLMPDLGTQSMEEFPIQASLDDYNHHPYDLVRTPEHDSLSLDENRASSARETSSFTSTIMGVPANAVTTYTRAMRSTEPARPTPSFSPTDPPQQMDKLVFQQREEKEQPRRGNSSAFAIAPPSSSIDQQHSQAQRRDRGSLTETRSQLGACKCLQIILGLLEEFENRASTTETYTMDSVLAYQKEALDHCNHMVRCSACIARSDHMMLLGVVSDKLITSYEQAITEHTEGARKRVVRHERQSGTLSSSPSLSRSSSPGEVEGEGVKGFARVVFFGAYKIEGATEWEYIIRVLITLQLRQAFELLTRMQHIAKQTSRGPQISALRMREQRLKIITAKIQRSRQS